MTDTSSSCLRSGRLHPQRSWVENAGAILPAKPGRTDSKMMSHRIRDHQKDQKPCERMSQAQDIQRSILAVDDRGVITTDKRNRHQEPIWSMGNAEERCRGQACSARRGGCVEAIEEIAVQNVLLQQTPRQIAG